MDYHSGVNGATFRELLGALMLQKKERADSRLKLFDVIELRFDASEPASPPWGGRVAAGALGTIVEELANDFYLVEFDGDGTEEPAVMTLPARALSLHWSAPV
jgi:hypothetical protein